MEKDYRLAVLDYNSGTVFIYQVDDMQSEDYEEFLIKKGFKLDQISWMVSTKETFDIFYEN